MVVSPPGRVVVVEVDVEVVVLVVELVVVEVLVVVLVLVVELVVVELLVVVEVFVVVVVVGGGFPITATAVSGVDPGTPKKNLYRPSVFVGAGTVYTCPT